VLQSTYDKLSDGVRKVYMQKKRVVFDVKLEIVSFGLPNELIFLLL
jgi:hypothetical protein